MKRIISFLIVLLLCMNLFGAKVYLENLVKSLTIYGYLDEYVLLYVEELEANSNSTTGMPFDITGDDVKYNERDTRMGRQICSWSFATNMPTVKLSITANPLTSDTDSTFKINYYMTFAYEYAKIDSNGNTSDVIGYLTMHSGQTQNHLNNYVGNTLVEPGISALTITNTSGVESMPIISMNKDIRFMFDSTAPENFDSYPAGYYFSTVTIALEAN